MNCLIKTLQLSTLGLALAFNVNPIIQKNVVITIPAVTASLTVAVPQLVLAAEDELEVAELPPVWVPILFAIVIMVGAGVLTLSLGDVYNEESLLGMQSGARAKKERERARSSYFKRSD